MARQETQNPKNKRLQLDRTQAGVLLAFLSVGLVLAFGGGFITGMWYQTHEQNTPLAFEPASKMSGDKSDEKMTFYSTLTRPEASAESQLDLRPVSNRQPAKQSQPPVPDLFDATSPRALSEQQYSIQVGSFRARDEAENLHKFIESKGYKAIIKTALVPGKGILYRVRVGQFAQREAAKRIAHRLRSEERLAAMITVITP